MINEQSEDDFLRLLLLIPRQGVDNGASLRHKRALAAPSGLRAIAPVDRTSGIRLLIRVCFPFLIIVDEVISTGKQTSSWMEGCA